jgi:hypothetical protein
MAITIVGLLVSKSKLREKKSRGTIEIKSLKLHKFGLSKQGTDKRQHVAWTCYVPGQERGFETFFSVFSVLRFLITCEGESVNTSKLEVKQL